MVSAGMSHTAPAIRIADAAVHQGLNVHAPVPVIRLTLEATGPTTPAAPPAFAQALLEHVPTLGGLDGLLDRLRRGDDLPLTEVVARVATELQIMGGADLPRTSVADVDAGAVYAYDDPNVGVAAGEVAVRLVEALLAGEYADLAGDVAAFVKPAELRHLSSTDVAIVRGARERDIPVVRQDPQPAGPARAGPLPAAAVGLPHQPHPPPRQQDRLEEAVRAPPALDTRSAAGHAGMGEYAGEGRGCGRDDRLSGRGQAEARQHGPGVSVGVTDAAGVRAAFDLAAPGGIPVVQNYVPGDDHRMLVINGELIGVVKRVPAHVVGDGVSSVEALVEVANRDPRRGPGHRRALTLLALDERAERMLARRGFDRHSVPAEGEVVDLCDVANVSLGGIPVDVTDDVPPTTARRRCEPRSPSGSTSSAWTT
jgi:cyanophycin synthetase